MASEGNYTYYGEHFVMYTVESLCLYTQNQYNNVYQLCFCKKISKYLDNMLRV